MCQPKGDCSRLLTLWRNQCVVDKEETVFTTIGEQQGGSRSWHSSGFGVLYSEAQ